MVAIQRDRRFSGMPAGIPEINFLVYHTFPISPFRDFILNLSEGQNSENENSKTSPFVDRAYSFCYTIIMKQTKNILSYPAIFDPIPDEGFEGGFNVSFPDFPGCVTFGDTFEEAEKMAEDALSVWIEVMIEQGEEIPTRTKSFIVHDISAQIPVHS